MEATGAGEGPLSAEADRILRAAVGDDLHDDRFEPPRDGTVDESVLAVARIGDQGVAAVSASLSRNRWQLDTVADLHALSAMAGAYDTEDTAKTAAAIVEQLIAQLPTPATTPSPDETPVTEIWGRPRQPWHDRLSATMGLHPHRTLYQMRCDLASVVTTTKPITTRAVDPSTDTAHLVEVNNRAFSYHPDQSDQRVDDIAAAFAVPGFDPASVRILDPSPSVTGQVVPGRPMAGFCWTKLHEPDGSRPALGEIYVIAVDPAYHGRGLGTGLTAAGLHWLAEQGTEIGMLYVESDNAAAVRTYEKLGFSIHSRYTAWRFQTPEVLS